MNLIAIRVVKSSLYSFPIKSFILGLDLKDENRYFLSDIESEIERMSVKKDDNTL